MAAVEWVLSEVSGPVRACDVAAGTGALTRLLEARVGEPVLAVEPDPRMVAVLVSRIPNTLAVRDAERRCRGATARSTPS